MTHETIIICIMDKVWIRMKRKKRKYDKKILFLALLTKLKTHTYTQEINYTFTVTPQYVNASLISFL